MKYLLCFLLMFATAARADEPPPIPEGGLAFFLEGPCSDNETGERGYCYMGRATDGSVYLTFYQDDELMMVRKVTGDSYKTIWQADHFASY